MSGGLDIGLRALLSARTVLDTIGHNMANANTPGYSRQQVSLSAAMGLPNGRHLVGSGVQTDQILRSIDSMLGQRILAQRAASGGLDARAQGLSELEALLGAGGEGGLSGLVQGFFTAVSDLAASPTDPILRTSLVQSSESVASRIRELDGQVATFESGVRREIDALVSDVNTRAKAIADLNRRIGEAWGRGVNPNDLLDQRDRLVTELGELVEVTTVAAKDGTVSVLVSGNVLVSTTRSVDMQATEDPTGAYRIALKGSKGYVSPEGGRVAGLLELGAGDTPALRSDFDELARQLIQSVNRVHATGLPPGGGFSVLRGTNVLMDVDGDGKVADELLSNVGLPFDVETGALFVNTEEKATGEVRKHRIDVVATHTTVQDLVDRLNAIQGLSAAIDSNERLRISADAGYAFDFSRRIETFPGAAGSFGGPSATVTAPTPGPYALADGDTLTLTANPGGTGVSFTIDFEQEDFFEISRATAEEVAEVIRNHPDAQANGITAVAVAGSVSIQTLATGSGASVRVDGGTALAGLGLTAVAGSIVTGQDTSVDPELSGAYGGDTNETFTFRPNMDGRVGTTPGLAVEVRDAQGVLVATLDVGEGYVPGTALEVADGLQASFRIGDLSVVAGDVFDVDLVAQPDTTGALVALGINSFFTGSGAADIGVDASLLANPDRIASSALGVGGDSTLLLELLDVKDAPQQALGGASIADRYGDVVADLGFEVASTRGARDASQSVLDSLEVRRDRISGVDVDEELVDLVAFEQAFSAASRYISVVSQLSDELLSLL